MSLAILVVGNGGREHALAWKLSQSPRVKQIYVAPGNGGTGQIDKVKNIDIGVSDFSKLVDFALLNNVDLVVPGPEVPLVDGIEGHFRRQGIPCFGPSQAAAQMEGSKAFSKDFMKRYNIPTASYENFTDYQEACAYINNVRHDIVIKASGLAAGKGVIIPQSKEDALDALSKIMIDKEFGTAGNEVVIEELLVGEELSVLAFSDGYTIQALPAAQDHKRIFDGDQGPNTGGMGCYSPIPLSTSSLSKIIQDTILQPTIDGMRRDGMPFLGMLFTGIMLTQNGPKVLEYNVRFGDPETQTVLPLLESDLAELMLACVERRLDCVKVTINSKYSATVVVVAGGYPDKYDKGHVITVKPVASETYVFHAGTMSNGEEVLTAGGRVIAVTSTALTLKAAVDAAYAGIQQITFEKAFYRKDIAHRAFNTKEVKEVGLTYAASGVNIDAGNTLVERIKPAVRATKRIGADSEIGGFGGTFDLEACNFSRPILIGATDGVGTKLLVANAMNKHDTVGIDLVAMNVNDLVVQGAEPLFFLDYFASSALDIDIASDFVKGVAAGCIESGCALVGGETAEMPDIYQGKDYDAAGTAVGAVERDQILPRMDLMQEGDVLIGLSSSGTHSNGFSLVRKIVARAGLSYQGPAPWNSTIKLGDALLVPTRIYVKPLLPLCRAGLIKGMAHITGGGLVENVPRMLPPELTAQIDLNTWEVPDLFQWMKKAGGVPTFDIAKTLNMGIGMVLVLSPNHVAELEKGLADADMELYHLGRLIKRQDDTGCVLLNLDRWDF